MRNEERILVLVYQPSVDGISQRCWLFYGLFFFFFGRVFYCSVSKRKIKLNCVHINFREHNVHSCLFLFSFSAIHSSIRFLSLLFVVVVVGWDHSDGSHSLRLIVGNRSLKLLHFSPARTLISTLGLAERQNKRTEKEECVNYSRKIETSPWWTAESCAPHRRTYKDRV